MIEKTINKSPKENCVQVNLLDQGYLVPVFSGGPGGGKSTLANKIAALFGVPIISAGTILRDKHKELYPTKTTSFEDWYGTLGGRDLKELNDEIKLTFESGKVIGESRLVSHLDASKCLFIYVDADVSIKTERLSQDTKRNEYYGKTIQEIAQILKKRTLDELKVARELAELYNISNTYDYRDSQHYHVYIDSGVQTLEEEIAQVLAKIKK